MTRKEAEQKLQKLFAIPNFHNRQWEVIEQLLAGTRILLIEKTGFGKSLCYQFPATQFSGITIIFSPLIALMRDQVQKLQKLGISAACINSNQSQEQNDALIQEAGEGRVKILYIAPERMENTNWLLAIQNMNISMVVVDEAHCISVWGHDFRPAFRRIIDLVKLLPQKFPVLATTATATKRVEQDILEQIGEGLISYRGRLLRNNLKLGVVALQSEEEKMLWLAQQLPKIAGSGLVYTGTQVNAEFYSNWLAFIGLSATFYHGGLDPETRKRIEAELLENKHKAIVSTNALGMGIDKPDIRFIVHTQIPVSPIHYYQEIGRAGRDGKPSRIVLLYNKNEDLVLPQSFIDTGRPPMPHYFLVISILKQEVLRRNDIIRKANLKQTQVQVILADLLDQGIIRQVIQGKSKYYEYQFNAPELDSTGFENLRQAKQDDFQSMMSYAEGSDCRMNFLCSFLGDPPAPVCGLCDNDTKESMSIESSSFWEEKLQEFKESYFPILEVQTKKSQLLNGVAASYYGISNVGKAIHNSKYKEAGYFPDWLLTIACKAYKKHLSHMRFDLILYVPPSESGDLVENLAQRLSYLLKIPLSYGLRKTRDTKAQKVFQTALLKRDNVKNAFIFEAANDLIGKSVLLIDDIYDSGATIKEIGSYLSSLGVHAVVPLTLAKTTGGDL